MDSELAWLPLSRMKFPLVGTFPNWLYGTTNVAFGEGDKELFVTVVKDPNDPKAKGSIVKIPNVK